MIEKNKIRQALDQVELQISDVREMVVDLRQHIRDVQYDNMTRIALLEKRLENLSTLYTQLRENT